MQNNVTSISPAPVPEPRNKIIRKYTDDHGTPCLELEAPGGSFLIEAADLSVVAGHRWAIDRRGHQAQTYVKYIACNRHPIYLHRVIMDPPRGTVVDHANGDTLDNRRSNLRVVSIDANTVNSRTTWGKLGVRGVCRDRNRYRAYLGRRYVGLYDSLPEAVAARSAAVAAKYGPDFVQARPSSRNNRRTA